MSKKAWNRIHAKARTAAAGLLADKLAAILERRPPWWWYVLNLWRFWEIPDRRAGYIAAHHDAEEARIRADVKSVTRTAEKLAHREGVHHATTHR